jgi:hypothetical protein
VRVLRQREFRLLWFGQGASTFGDRLVFVTLAFAVALLGFAVPYVWCLRALEARG